MTTVHPAGAWQQRVGSERRMWTRGGTFSVAISGVIGVGVKRTCIASCKLVHTESVLTFSGNVIRLK